MPAILMDSMKSLQKTPPRHHLLKPTRCSRGLRHYIHWHSFRISCSYCIVYAEKIKSHFLLLSQTLPFFIFSYWPYPGVCSWEMHPNYLIKESNCPYCQCATNAEGFSPVSGYCYITTNMIYVVFVELFGTYLLLSVFSSLSSGTTFFFFF